VKKEKFIEELRKMIREEVQSATTMQPNWLRSSQVREMLNISDSTLQTFRVNKTIPAYKLDNMWFYKYDEIIGVLEANCIRRKEV
jgi:hypothetical protein